MTDGDNGVDDEPLSSDFDILLSVVASLCPARGYESLPPPGYDGRMVHLGAADGLKLSHIRRAVMGLAADAAETHVDAVAAIELLRALERLSYKHPEVEDLRDAVIAWVVTRWEVMRSPLAERVIANEDRWIIFRCFPGLKREPELIIRLADSISDTQRYLHGVEDLLREVGPTSIPQARLLIDTFERRCLHDRAAPRMTETLFAAIGRGLGWNAWATLQTILRACPHYAAPHARFAQVDDQAASHETKAARGELAANIAPQIQVRQVAAAFLDAFGSDRQHDGLLSRPTEVRAAYIDALGEEIDGDRDLRQAVIEALLWNAGGRSADLAQFASVALAQPVDRAMLTALDHHPNRVVRYSARAVRAARYGEPLAVRGLPGPGGLVQSLVALDGGVAPSDEPARTWLGDRTVERLIEQTIAAEEARFAREYGDHGDEGEDRLLSSLFSALAMRFGDLNHALESLARAASSPRRATISLRYRNIDRAEEGGPGIKGAESFSADLCLIVDPSLDGKSLGRRVTLVQAKRLYRYRRAKKQTTWHSSYDLKPDQVRDLLAQTHSSVYFFHGPPMGGRGIPVIPTQLVADLSQHQGSGAQLATDMVAAASRSLADWLTYDALALRTGDLYQDLIDQAEGREGSLPRRLLELPTVEAEVAIVTFDPEL
jgi:hypothetical protein